MFKLKSLVLFSSLTLSIGFFLLSFSSAKADITTGLVGHWKLDETSGTTASDSSGTNNGTLTNGPTWTTGKLNNSLNFDGTNDYVSIPLLNRDEISVSAWFNKNANDTANADAIFGGWRWSSNLQQQEGFDLRFHPSSPDRLDFILTSKNGSGTRTTKTGTYGFSNSVGNWYYVAGTYNKTTGEQKLYVDGQLVNTQLHPAGNTIVPLTSYSDMRIGYSMVNNGYMNGKIDDVRIYSRALSSSEITGLYSYTGGSSNSSSVPFSSSSSVITIGDITPPSISITSPTTNTSYSTTNSTVSISGTASDNIGVSSVTCTNNSSSCGTVSGTTSWSISSIPLSTGTNTITVTAKDSSNNTKTDTLAVNRTTTTTTSSNQWIQVPKRTQAQKTAGIAGGEGWQMIFGIAYAPSNPNIVYFVTDTSQVWKSTDGGTSWRKTKATGFGALGGASIVVHPTNPDIVHVAGGTMLDSTIKVYPDTVKGIFRTTDGGDNWTLVKSANFTRDNSRGGIHIVYAGSNMYAAPSQEGILKSTNGGTTWNLLNKSGGGYVLDTLSLRNIVVHPTNNTILYVSTSNGLYKVEDSGGSATVTKIGTGLPSGTVYQLVIDPNTPATMYIAAGTNGVWKSTNGGSSFSKILSAPVNSQGKTGGAYHIAMSPVNSSKLIVTFRLYGNYVYHTSNGGTSWTQTTNMDESNASGWIAGSILGYTANNSGVNDASAPIAFHPTDENIALVNGWASCIKKTTDGGATWKYSNTGYTGAAGGTLESSSAIGWDSTNYNRAAFAHLDFGTMVTEDNEHTFTARMNTTYNNRNATVAVAMRGNIIVEAVGHNNNDTTAQVIAISRNSGASWTQIGSATATFKLVEFHPQDSNIVYAGNYKFTNIQTNNNYTTLSKPIMAVYKGDGDTVYSYSGSTVYKSTNAGGTWTTPYPSLSLPSGSIQQIAVSPTDENRIYAAVKGTVTVAGVYIINNTTANGGTVAKKIYNNGVNGLTLDQFGELNVLTVATDPNNANIVYAGTRASWKGQTNGVFRSIDGGNTWSNITNDTFGTMFFVTNIIVSPKDSYVYLSSYSGTWKLPPPGTSGGNTIDTTAPSVSITSPTSASTYSTTQSTVSLYGTASDSSGISSVTCSINGSSCGTVSGTTSWSVSNIHLSSGSNTITITAKDSSSNGNTSSKTLIINLSSPSSSSSSSSSLSSSSSTSSSSSSSSLSLPTLTTTTKKTLSPITIDGNLSESVWNPTESINRTISGTNNNTSTFQTLWDNTYLYVAYKVLDSNLKNDSVYPWLDDGVELYLDPNNSKSTTYDTYDRHFVKGYNDNTLASIQNGTGVLHGTTNISGGYTVELAIPWTNLNLTPSNNMTIGFDLQQNDDDTGGDLQLTKGWNSVTGTNYKNTSAFGNLSLSSQTVGSIPQSSSSSSSQSSSSSTSSSSSSSTQSSASSLPSSSSSSSSVSTTNNNTSAVSGGNGGGGGGGVYTPSVSYGSTLPETKQTNEEVLPTYSSSYPTTSISRKVVGPFSFGTHSNEVKTLQEMLSSDGLIYPEGEVTGYYGSLTVKAVKRFQSKHGIEETGLAGPLTRTKLNEVYGQTYQTQSSFQTTLTSSNVFSKEMSLGDRGDDVTLLQNRLTSEGVYSGPITGYYGRMTQEGVKKYQAKNNISQVGRVGPQTLSFLNGSSSQSSSESFSLRGLVELLISLGVISPDKVDLARTALQTMEGR